MASIKHNVVLELQKHTQRELNIEEKELGELKTELFKLRFGLATNGLDNPMKIKETKKDIARVKTILKERELAEQKREVGSER